MPELSIVVVTHKAIRYVRKLFDSLYLYPPFLPFEVICVDNASCPPAVAYLKELHSRGKIHKLVLNDRNLFYAKANNIAFGMCSKDSRYILRLDSDVEFMSSRWFETLFSVGADSVGYGILPPPVRHDSWCWLMRRSAVGKPVFDERYPTWGAPSLLESKLLQRGSRVVAIRTDPSLVRHYWGKGRREAKVDTGLWSGHKLREWFQGIPEAEAVKSVCLPVVRPTERRGKFAVASMAFGEFYEKVAKISFPTFAEYAKRIGADFIAINQRKFPENHLFMEKFQVRDLLEKYDAVLWVDADAFISRRAPSIFDEVPPGTFAAWDEGERNVDTLEGVSRHIGIPISPDRPFAYINTGVFVVWKECRSVFSDPLPPARCLLYGEQGPLNLIVAEKRVPFYSLPMRWNSFRLRSGKWTEPPNIIHFAGDHTDLAHRLSEWISLDTPY